MANIISKIDQLIEKPCYLIDIFPHTVPKTTDGRYFAVEEFFQNNRAELNEKFCRILLKLYCYYDFLVLAGEETAENPQVSQLINWVRHCFAGAWQKRDYINIILLDCNAMVVLNGDDLYMSLYNPDEKLVKLASQLAGGEGLFLYKAPET